MANTIDFPSERTPLISEDESAGPLSSSSRTVLDLPDQARADQEVGGVSKLDFKLFTSLLWDSIPVVLSYILQNSIQTASIVIAGRLGPNELSVAAFSLMFAFDGLSHSEEPPLSTPWALNLSQVEAEKPTLGLLWYYIEPVLLAFGQPGHLARDVQQFLRILIIGAPGYVGFESLKKYLQCQGIMGASTTVLIIVSPINIALNILLVHYTPLGVLGSPFAVSITYWLCFFTLGIWTCYSSVHRQNGTWGGFNLVAALDPAGCFDFLKLALPGILMVGTEWAAFEIVALAAGRLGEIPLAAQSIIMTTDQILNTLPFGIGVAASARVGNLIGARSAPRAKIAAHAAALLSVVVGSVVMIAMIASKDVYGLLFSDDIDVVRLVSKVMPLVASFQVADGLAGSCGGVLRGQGRQHLGAFFNIVAYYVLALPMGITLAFHPKTHLGLQGLWIGQVVALFIVGIGEYCVVWLGTDWDKEIQKAIERNEREGKRGATASANAHAPN
ncbi:hypothetical protein D9613_007273 [Agrocybe pediades]|uniref:MOP flippase n=1 Tax=Agrocybe pediades TaxID=84607 RepID=A0A8H4QH47_9AGAR|nr:hypothetical protein D9613_007273 [Agrocybe pediades]